MPRRHAPARNSAAPMLALGLTLIGIALLLAAWIFISDPVATVLDPTSPEAQFTRALADGKPIFAFFHSTDC